MLSFIGCYIQPQSFEHEFWYLQDHTFAASIYVRQLGLFIDKNGLLKNQPNFTTIKTPLY